MKTNSNIKQDLIVMLKIYGVFLLGCVGVGIIFLGLYLAFAVYWIAGVFTITAGASLIWFSYAVYDSDLKAANDAIDKRIKQENLNKIDTLLQEIDVLDNEVRMHRKIVEDNKKAIFGEKAKLRKRAQKQISKLESEIEDKRQAALRIKDRL